MKSNSKCNIILLPKLDNSNLFFPLNYTATIDDYPTNQHRNDFQIFKSRTNAGLIGFQNSIMQEYSYNLY